MTATDTYLLLRAFCDELARCGMQHACTSPGSRCTPIVMSLAGDSRIRCWSHLDERCAGFFALGAAKVSGRPVAVTCTSGTAAANLAPAVIEAQWARVPLLVLTADRPPELRDVGAGQTIDQLKLYGSAVKWFFEVGVYEGRAEQLRWIRTLACRAYWTACQGVSGPVHLNFPLREPLVLDQPLPPDETGRTNGRPYVITEPERRPFAPAEGPGPHPSGRLLIVAGAGTSDPVRLAEYAARNGIPILADPLSGARRAAASVAHYDLLLRAPQFTDSHRPHFIFRLGELPTSKPLRGWLGSLSDVPQIAVDPARTWHDPASVVGMRIRSPLPMPDQISVEDGWLEAWRAADRAVATAIDQALDTELSEPLVARSLPKWLPGDAILFIASSMPIRDVEAFLPTRDEPPLMLANRGANGIDGTVSSAFGVAAATGRRVVLLVGDVALAHDIGGLLATRRLGLELTIVLINNDGGGIFDFLPVASAREPLGDHHGQAYEQHVATPHGLDFATVAALYDCTHERPVGLAELEDAVTRSIASSGTQIIEVRTDRARNVALHRRLTDAAIDALTGR
jgi:2-succinyl-5-enolpyruvyl-6-hydroxy-3-cyclohexene-1-carboxylate synthase